MWFQALEYAVSRTVAKYTFYCSRRTYSYHLVLVFEKSYLSLAATVETRATELRFSSRCPRRHLVHAGLAIAAATVFLDRATNEEQSTFYPDCCCCRATYELPNHLKKNWYHTNSCSFYSSKKYPWLQYEKRQIQAPGTTFCTKEPISVSKLWFKGKVRS